MTPLAAALAVLAVQASQDGPGPLGYWVNPKGTVVVEITECGGEALCGRVSWASPEAIADANRAGAAPLLGTVLLDRFVAVRPGRWRGKLYVPDLRKTRTAELRFVSGDRLEIRGCVAARLICKSQVWNRIEQARQE